MMKKSIGFVILLTFLWILSVGVGAEEYIVKFTDSAVAEECEGRVTKSGYDDLVFVTDDVKISIEYAEYIEYFEPNGTLELIEGEEELSLMSSTPAETYYPLQWQTQMINAERAWELETYGNGVPIAVIDSGVNMHTEIAKNIVGGYNYIDKNEDLSDEIGHGTHVAGIIVANHNNIGIAGVAPKARIYALKCFTQKASPTYLMLATAIKDAVDKYDCKIITMSLGTMVDNSLIYDAVQHAYSKGAIIIAAVGNDGTKDIYYPAGYDEVIGVGSVGMTKEKSYFSQVNSSVFVVASGEDVISLSGTGGYTRKKGTSQAAPYVTAAAAIALSADESVTASKFKKLIMASCEDIGDVGYDTTFGWGLLDIGAMMNILTKDSCYASPVNDGELLIVNNSESVVNTVGVYVAYDGARYTSCDFKSVIIMPERKIKLSVPDGMKFFLWDFSKGMKPLTMARQAE